MSRVVRLVFVLLFCSFSAIAQERNSSYQSNINDLQTDTFDDTEDSAPHDTVEVNAFRIVGLDNVRKEIAVIDTMIDNFQTHDQIIKRSFSNTYLGNHGTSYISNLYFDRPNPSQYSFSEYLDAYFNSEKTTVFHKTRTPYSLVSYYSGPNRSLSDQSLRFIHTQNVSEDLNFAIKYDGFSSEGFYENQKTRNNDLSFSAGYDNGQYQLYAGTNFNWHRMKENGGLSDIEFFENPNNRSKPDAQPMSLSGAQTELNSHNAFLVQTYHLGKYEPNEDSILTFKPSRFSIEHVLRYRTNKRDFTDGGVNPNYFGDYIYEPSVTVDTSTYRSFSNAFYLVFNEKERNKITAGFKAGIVAELDKYGHSIIPDTLFSEVVGEEKKEIISINKYKSYRYSNIALSGAFFNHTGNLINWDVGGRLYINGYKTADFEIEGSYSMHFTSGKKGPTDIILSGNLRNQSPSYFVNEYVSNYFMWDNNFDKENELSLAGQYLNHGRQLKAGIHLSRLDNYVYFNQFSKPEQASDGIMLAALDISKNLKIGHLGIKLRGVYQYVNKDDIYPLPDFTAYQSTYYECFLVKNVLQMQIGYDLFYNTAYYAYNYQPATGIFILQPEEATQTGLQREKIGNYPFVDLFLNLKLKRARLFLKYEHANANLMPASIKRKYMTAFSYPEHPAMIRFGVSWSFYD